jgi:cation/acetate symporter
MTAVVIGLLSIVGGYVAIGQNVASLVALAFALAASANLPTILYTLFWRRFNTTGSLFSMYGGLGSCLLLIVFSPVFSGSATSFVKGVDFHLFPLNNPGIISIPLSFLLGFFGTVLSRDRADEERSDELEVRSVTGIGATVG